MLTCVVGGVWTRLGIAASVEDGRRSSGVLGVLPITDTVPTTLLRRRRLSSAARSLRRDRRSTASLFDRYLLPLSPSSRHPPTRQSVFPAAAASCQYLSLRPTHFFRQYIRSEKFSRIVISTTPAVPTTILTESSAPLFVQSIRSTFSIWIALLSESESTAAAAEDGREYSTGRVGDWDYWGGRSAAGETTGGRDLASLTNCRGMYRFRFSAPSFSLSYSPREYDDE